MKIKERVDLINGAIKMLEKERSFIRSSICKHQQTHIGTWADRPGRSYPALICSDCGINLKAVTPEEYTLVQVGKEIKYEKKEK